MKAYTILLGYIMPGKRNEKQEESRGKEGAWGGWIMQVAATKEPGYSAMDHWAFEDPYKLHPRLKDSGCSEGGEIK